MSCLSPELLREYPHPIIAIFGSTVDTQSNGFDATAVDDAHDGMIAELERAGQHSTEPGSNNVAENPYSTRLRPLSNLSDFLRMKGVPAVIESVLFYAIDSSEDTPTEVQPVAGTEYQDPVVAAEIVASQSSSTDAIYASRFKRTIIGNWQPNWFRPALIVNGRNLFPNIAGTQMQDTNGQYGHLGDLSIGLPLPFSMDLAREFPHGIDSIEAYGQVVQHLEDSASARKYVRYPVIAVVVIRHK